MTIPQELHWIQHLIDHRGVSGTLRLIASNCSDRHAAGRPPRDWSRILAWSQLGALVAACAEEAAKLEPPQPIVEEEPEKEDDERSMRCRDAPHLQRKED
jgi:hypothetical protein